MEIDLNMGHDPIQTTPRMLPNFVMGVIYSYKTLKELFEVAQWISTTQKKNLRIKNDILSQHRELKIVLNDFGSDVENEKIHEYFKQYLPLCNSITLQINSFKDVWLEILSERIMPFKNLITGQLFIGSGALDSLNESRTTYFQNVNKVASIIKNLWPSNLSTLNFDISNYNEVVNSLKTMNLLIDNLNSFKNLVIKGPKIDELKLPNWELNPYLRNNF